MVKAEEGRGLSSDRPLFSPSCHREDIVNRYANRTPTPSIWFGGLEESHDGAQYGMKGGADHEKETEGEHGKV